MTEHYLDRLARTITENWNRPALTDFYLTDDGTAQDTTRGNRYTYGELYHEILRLGELFRALGLKKGDHIAICGANSTNWAVAYLAIAAYQGVAVTVLHSQSVEDIAHQIDFSDAKALFTDPDLWSELSPMYQLSLGDVSVVLSLADWTMLSCDQSADNYDTYTIDTRKIHDTYTLHSDTLTEGTQEEINHRMHRPILGDISFPSSAPNDLAMICFTSGSTETSKGVMLSNRNLCNNALNAIQAFPDSVNGNFACFLPFSHMYGFMIEFLGQIIRGKHLFVYRNTFNIEDIWKTILFVRPYGMAIIPFLITNLYTKHKKDIYTNWSEFCSQIHIGGSVPDNSIVKEMREHHIPVSVGYGSTETGPLISDSQSNVYRIQSSGTIVDGMTARIAPNGEILVKGENVMLGYYKNTEATALKIDTDGWLHTGDKGHLDEDGYLYVEGRLEQDMIVLPNGENIHPEDVEQKINALPEVSESVVFARNGQLIAVVVPAAPFTAQSSTFNNSNALRRHILCSVNPDLPLFSQLCDVEFSARTLAKTEKQTLKRYLYK